MYYKGKRKEIFDFVRRCVKSFSFYFYVIKVVDVRELMKLENVNICLRELLVNFKEMLKISRIFFDI